MHGVYSLVAPWLGSKKPSRKGVLIAFCIRHCGEKKQEKKKFGSGRCSHAQFVLHKGTQNSSQSRGSGGSPAKSSIGEPVGNLSVRQNDVVIQCDSYLGCQPFRNCYKLPIFFGGCPGDLYRFIIVCSDIPRFIRPGRIKI